MYQIKLSTSEELRRLERAIATLTNLYQVNPAVIGEALSKLRAQRNELQRR